MRKGSILVLVFVSLMTALSACGGGGGGSASTPSAKSPPAPPPPPAPTPVSFQDVTSSSGIAYTVGITPPFKYPGTDVDDSTFGGAAAGDCDGDGDIDLFITYGDAGPNRLYLNQLVEQGLGLQFVDTAEAAGVAYTRSATLHQNNRQSGPTFADMDGDGDLDLFMGGILSDPARIYRNDGDCRFSDVTADSPQIANMIADQTISAAFGDYDLDGDLDMFLTHWGTSDDLYDPGVSEHLWKNVSDSSHIEFVNDSAASNVTDILWQTRYYTDSPVTTQDYDYTFTPTFARISGDVWPDIAVASDDGTSQLLINLGDATFRNATEEQLHTAKFGMGSALADYDNDGDLDWFITSIFGEGPTTVYGNRFFRNRILSDTAVYLEDVSEYINVQSGGWGWGACFLDIDNDTDLDIYHTNGWPRFFEGGVYTNDTGRVFVQDHLRFSNEAASFGLDDDYSGRGVVCADFDEDGDIDILQLTNREPNSGVLWENRTAAAGNNYLRVKLNGLPPNTAAAGARIYVTIGSQTQMREITIGSNFITQNPTVQVFGLGPAAVVDEVRVEWPARLPGPSQPPDTKRTAVAANQTLLFDQPPYP